MTRGFVTLATGNVKYYKMAANMLRSFRIHNPDAKMAILCDSQNEYTKEFDEVVVMSEACGNYKDKFRLLVESPYDENIFIEPDCFIYRNLDFFWDILSGDSDFSSFGWNESPLSVWFETEEALKQIKSYLPETESFPLFNPGYFFVRRGEACRKMFRDCFEIAEFITNDPILKNDSRIMCNGKLRDDPVLSLAMEKNGFVCNAKPRVAKCISLPSKYRIDLIDMRGGRLDVTDKNGESFRDCALIHFSTRKVEEEGLYLWQKTVVDLIYKNKNRFILRIAESKPMLGFFEAFRYIKTRLCHLFK